MARQVMVVIGQTVKRFAGRGRFQASAPGALFSAESRDRLSRCVYRGVSRI